MLTKNTLKFIKSLQIKKFRREHKAFLVEGGKSVLEVLQSDWKVNLILCTEIFHRQYRTILDKSGVQIEIATEMQLSDAGNLEQNHTALAVVNIPVTQEFSTMPRGYVLVLDEIKDPGNLGTILRTADWFGIQSVVCSEYCAELYNPKTIAACMGSFTRVKVYNEALVQLFKKYPQLPVYGAFMDGLALNQIAFSDSGFVLMGNEANGINPALFPFVTHRLNIPGKGGAESLNVAVAAGIILSRLA